MKKRQMHTYYRTAALLGAQQRPYARVRHQVHIPVRENVPFSLIAVLVVIIGAALWLWLDNRWYLMGENIQVVGTTSNTTAYNAAMASDLLGWHGLRLRPKAAEALIVEKVTAVTGAQVECYRFPASCVIRIVERTPVMNWVTTEGATYWLDSAGRPFPTQSVRPDLPVITGLMPVLGEAQTLLPVIEGAQALIALGVAPDQLEYNSERGLIWTDPEGRRVAFGTGAAMEPRWRIYEALVEHLEARNVFPWAIDVRFPEGPTYSLERLW